MEKTSRTFVKLAVAVAIAICVSANVSLGYHLFTKSERNVVGKVVPPEAVAILMARK